MIKHSRAVVITIALALIGTFYSMSELNRISALHLSGASSDLRSSKPASRVSRLAIKKQQKLEDVDAVKPVPSPALSTEAGGHTKTTVIDGAKKCFVYEHTELWGDVVGWGGQNKVATVGECCDSCRNFVPENPADHRCNVFVWNGVAGSNGYQECWLKHLPHPDAAKPAKEGPLVPWTSGTIDIDIKARPLADKTVLRPFHTVTTAMGSATHWQCRIHYYWFKKQKYACEQQGKCEMGGFTRLLHSGVADDLMGEMPTVVVDPLPKDAVANNWYVVLNRPYAFVQWVKIQKIPEKYVLMAEPDHVFIRPMPNFMTSENPAAFPFFYIVPGADESVKCTMKYTGQITKQQLDEIAPIGNSPTFMNLEDMAKVMPIWMNTSIEIFKDAESNKAWGWVQEMYGFTIAVWLAGIKRVDLFMNMMAQPPWDEQLEMDEGRPFHIIHYTYGMDYKLTGEFTPGKYGEWRYDKRTFSGRPMPRHLPEPPKAMKNELVRTLMAAFEEATAAIPCWDEYAKSGIASYDCGEKPGGFLAEELERAKAAGGAGATASKKRMLLL